MELIKLGLHKSSEDIRTQYLHKLHITRYSAAAHYSTPPTLSHSRSPPSTVSALVLGETAGPTPATSSDQTTADILKKEEVNLSQILL